MMDAKKEKVWGIEPVRWLSKEAAKDKHAMMREAQSPHRYTSLISEVTGRSSEELETFFAILTKADAVRKQAKEEAAQENQRIEKQRDPA